jgi:hypothetical protein
VLPMPYVFMQLNLPLTQALSPSDGERIPRKIPRIEPLNLSLCKPLIINDPFLRFMGRECLRPSNEPSPFGEHSRRVLISSLSPSDGERAGVRGFFDCMITLREVIKSSTSTRKASHWTSNAVAFVGTISIEHGRLETTDCHRRPLGRPSG